MAFVPSLLVGRTPVRGRIVPATSSRMLRTSSSPTSSNRRPFIQMKDSGNEELSVPLSSLNERLREKSSPAHSAEEAPAPGEEEEVEDTRSEAQKEIDRLRAAEKFIEIDEGKYECSGCGYVYEPQKGDPKAEIPPGTMFEDLPGSYSCPQCLTPKSRFLSRKKIIAGFAENQGYGFGSNAMTGGQKNALIFGGLVLCFLLLLSGYALN